MMYVPVIDRFFAVATVVALVVADAFAGVDLTLGPARTSPKTTVVAA